MAVIAELLNQPGLVWLVLAAVLAGLVRGFAGFGTAMVFMPVAGQILPPIAALTVITAMDLLGPLPNVPRAWRDGSPRELRRLALGLLLGLPLGLSLLGMVSVELFRILISVVSLTLLVLLVGGLRYRGPMGTHILVGAGTLGGFFGGVAGIAGPPVILLYMASTRGAAAIRANLLLFLLVGDLAALALLAAWGWLQVPHLVLGLALSLPYMLANVAGAAMFQPERATLYRGVGYAIIAGSALRGLPIWN